MGNWMGRPDVSTGWVRVADAVGAAEGAVVSTVLVQPASRVKVGRSAMATAAVRRCFCMLFRSGVVWCGVEVLIGYRLI